MKKECRLNLRVNTGGMYDFVYNLSRSKSLSKKEKEELEEAWRKGKQRLEEEEKKLEEENLRKENSFKNKLKRFFYYLWYDLLGRGNI